ncbi:MAG: site-2 protease family protein [Planctomycetota bacterium]|jgi:Zn-dependent protease
MFGKRLTLFKMFGFEVRIDVSWVFIFVLVAWTLAGAIFPTRYGGLSRGVYLVMGVAAAIGLFASVVFHELCHSLVARRFGIPMEGITLFIFGGVAEMSKEPESPKAEFLMAIAGPLSSLAIAAVLAAAAAVARRSDWPTSVVGVLNWVGIINIMLAAFNLIPGFPLDGGRVLRSILWHFWNDLRRATQTAAAIGSGFGGVLIALGVLSLLVLRNPIGGLWWIMIGLFVRAAAKQGLRQVVIREMLRGEPVGRFMNDRPIVVPPTMTIGQLVEDYIYRYHFKMFPVADGERLLGCVSTREVRALPREEWPHTTVGEILSACGVQNTLVPDEDALKALERMSKTGTSRMMVVEDGRLLGIISLKDLLKFLTLKLELETPGARPADKSNA